MKRLFCYSLFVLFVSNGAVYAACSNTVNVKDGLGAQQTFCVGTDGSSDLFTKVLVAGGSNGANTATVNASGQLEIDNIPNNLTATGTALNVNLSSPLGQAAMAASVPVVVASNQSAVQTTPVSTAGTGATNFYLEPTASDNHTVIKNGATTVSYVHVSNNSANVNYMRLYNAGTGFNGCNSATNRIWGMEIPASTAVGGFSVDFPVGLAFSTGLSICVSGGYGSTDTTNATATAMMINVGYN